MSPPPVRRSARVSAVQACLERLGAVWDEREGAVRPVHFGDPEAEAAIAPVLALADRGTIPRIGLKGPDAIGWARAQGIPVPDEIYGWTRAAGGGLSVRVGSGELFLEGPHAATAEEALAGAPSGTACWPVRREDAAFLLCGERALEVLAQACSYDFRGAAGTFVMTRVAMVSCSILVEEAWSRDAWPRETRAARRFTICGPPPATDRTCGTSCLRSCGTAAAARWATRSRRRCCRLGERRQGS